MDCSSYRDDDIVQAHIPFCSVHPALSRWIFIGDFRLHSHLGGAFLFYYKGNVRLCPPSLSSLFLPFWHCLLLSVYTVCVCSFIYVKLVYTHMCVCIYISTSTITLSPVSCRKAVSSLRSAVIGNKVGSRQQPQEWAG